MTDTTLRELGERVKASVTAEVIIDRLISLSEDKIWATELALPPWRERRIDFWTLEPIASRGFRSTVYEVKVSRSDFLRDSEEKQTTALSYADRFWYVTPPDMLKIEEIPPWAGLMEYQELGFAVRRRAPKREKREPDWEFVVSVIRNCGRTRRDLSLIMSQIKHLEFQNKRREDGDRHRMQWDNKRWMRRVEAQNAAANSETEPSP